MEAQSQRQDGETSSSDQTQLQTQTVTGTQLTLHLQGEAQNGQAERRHVIWTEATVDNEGLGKKKSKCCCIYKKPKKWDDQSDGEDEDSDCETHNCRGHVESKASHAAPAPTPSTS